MNIDDIRKLFETEVNTGTTDQAEVEALEIANPVVQAGEAIRKLVAALHQAPGSPPVAEQTANVDRIVAPFADYSDKILNWLADELIEEDGAVLSAADLAENVSAAESIIDKNRLDDMQDHARDLKAIEPSAITGLKLAVCTVYALPHSSALYSCSMGRDPQQMARQCQQECQDADNLDKSIRAALDEIELTEAYDKIAELCQAIYENQKSPSAKQQAKQLLELTDGFMSTADNVFQWAACARLNVLNARQFVDDLNGTIEQKDLNDLEATVIKANNAFFKRLLDDIAPALYGILLTDCVARKLVTKVS